MDEKAMGPLDTAAALQRNLAAAYPPAVVDRRWADPGAAAAAAGKPGAYQRYHHPEGDFLREGFAPPGLTQTDHCMIRHQGRYHLYATAGAPNTWALWPGQHHYIFHAVTSDFRKWELTGPVLYNCPERFFESRHVWPPFVVRQRDGRFAMIYCGMDDDDCQVLCLARSDDLYHWTRHGENPVLNPSHWPWTKKRPDGRCRHGRDPHVLELGQTYLLYYTTYCSDDYSAVGVAASSDLEHFTDLGPCFKRDAATAFWLTESPLVIHRHDRFYLLPSQSPGLSCFASDDPTNFHGAKPLPVIGGEKAIAPEVIDTSLDDRYLIGYHGPLGYRFVLGILHWENQGIRIERVSEPEQLQPWEWLR